MSRRVIGVLLIVIGALLLLDRLGYFSVRELLSQWWPFILVVIGGWQWFVNRSNASGGIVLVIVGGFFLLQRFGVVSWSVVSTYWPVLLIAAGLTLLLRSRRNHRVRRHSDGALNIAVVFGDTERIVEAPGFPGGDMAAIFGSIVLDLRGTSLPEEGSVVEVMVAFGDVKLRVPESWPIEMETVVVFGSSEDRRTLRSTPLSDAADAEGPRLTIRGLVVFGELEVTS